MREIRLIAKTDLPELKKVLDTIELFPPEMLEDMTLDYFNNPQSEEIWFTETEDLSPISIGYCAPEKLTDGTYNLYALGVRSDIQSKGTGNRMITFIQNHLKQMGKRILIIDTSSTEQFKSSRRFYEKLGYTKEAVIRDFWSEGDDKVIYWKRLD